MTHLAGDAFVTFLYDLVLQMVHFYMI